MAGICSGGALPSEGIQPSASRPVMVSARGPKVPSQIGMWWAGLGSRGAATVLWCLPSRVKAGSDHRPCAI